MTMIHFATLQVGDVGRHTIERRLGQGNWPFSLHAGGISRIPLSSVLGEVQQRDVGKRLYLSRGETTCIQVENDEQMRARLETGT